MSSSAHRIPSFMAGATTAQSDDELNLITAPRRATRSACAFLSRYRDRLKRMVSFRLNRRLAGRVDDSDIVQESFFDVSRRLDEYSRIRQRRSFSGCAA